MNPELSRLENGLTIITQTVDHVETLSMGVWVNVGSRNESEDVNGISHLLEHMAFKGTKTRSAKDIAEAIENVGGHLNAHTSREHTAYTARVLKEDLELSLDIISDILQNSTFEESELQKEKEVVIQEIYQSHDTPDDIIFDYYKEVAYPHQALGRSILGTPESVKSIQRDHLFQYMRDNYTPETMVLSVAGKIAHEHVVELAQKYFTQDKTSPKRSETPLQYKGGTKLIERDLEQIHLVLGFEGYAYGTEDYYRSSVLSIILSGGMSSRLFQELREKRGLVYTISTFNTPYRDGGLFNLYAGTSPDHINELLPTIQEELNKSTSTLTPEELTRARSQFKAALLMGLESTSAQCEMLANHILNYGRVIPLPEIIERIDRISLQDVQAVAETIFQSQQTFAAIGTVKRMDTFPLSA